ncbi:hypothetical protein I79_024799 [Cricetulus griseus]|uniref:Uncharacterized protein n=1 Tax=Cricetulus griseus TaxID=10029 RepID=G3ILM9_CRIGR|nr:hypothetical protein I79_024799 [Cricetulus griseus]
MKASPPPVTPMQAEIWARSSSSSSVLCNNRHLSPLRPAQVYHHTAVTPVTYSAGAKEMGLCCFLKVTKCFGI